MNNDSSVCNPFVVTFKNQQKWNQTVLPMKSQLAAPTPPFAREICIENGYGFGDTCQFSPDDRYLGTISGFGSHVKIWDCSTGNLVGTLKPCGIVKFGFLSCKEILCVIRDGQNHRVEIWNYSTFIKVHGSTIENVYDQHQKNFVVCAATSVCVHQTGLTKLQIFNCKTTTTIGEIDFDREIKEVLISPNGRWLAVITDGYKLVFWDLLAFTKLEETNEFCTHKEVHFFNESNQFVLFMFNVINIGPQRYLFGIACYPQSAYRHIIDFCVLQTDQVTLTTTKFENFDRAALAAVSANGKTISFDDGRHNCRNKSHSHAHALTSNGQILAFHEPNGIISIVDTTTKKLLKSFITEFESLKRMKFSKNGFVLLVENHSDIVQLFSLRDVMMSSQDQKNIMCLAKCRHLSKYTIFKIVKEIFIQKNRQQRVSDEYLLNYIHVLKSKAQITCGLSK